ncbi:DNA methyltransferase [Xylella fastidiosa]|uniref:DNA adenine methylase n=1 Tax=Xylella fastidiosa TaxID=2371 RepID=UPI00111F4CAC|nr:DNA adenine methylase [Xylella fastidiosa]MDD0929648.1 DNA adenine methylase [Xylella fastidiosa subsp. multiplex]QTX28518.1 DNA adenine methylase [Xylella fastidiosa subsp. multiplex]TNV88631.1 DNA methyltransferase [Xylella fastidiosa]TNV97866.1 DNA methyltransferase [Xylella fastidiosa]UIT41810.1 DNA adenine methylase [Xylella fastidiosa subsp. multiplex]
MPNPIIPWPGGKRRLLKHLYPHFPQHECYVEAFAGGAAVLLLRPNPAPVEVLNDINGDVVNLYRCVRHHLDEFVRQFRWALNSRAEWLREQRVRAETLTDIQRAARFYYLQKLAFGGKVVNQHFGFVTCGASRLNLLRIEEELSAVHVRLADVIIENGPWRVVVDRYDREHTLHYLDPPYWQQEGYGVDFPWSEYEAIADFMRVAKGRVVLSINDHPEIRELFEGMNIIPLQLRYSISRTKENNTPSGELIIKSWADTQAQLL